MGLKVGACIDGVIFGKTCYNYHKSYSLYIFMYLFYLHNFVLLYFILQHKTVASVRYPLIGLVDWNTSFGAIIHSLTRALSPI